MTTPTPHVDREVAGKVFTEIKALLNNAGMDFNFEFGTCRYSAQDLTFKVTARPKGAKDPARIALEAACKMHGFDPDATYTGKNGTFTLFGYNSRSPKMPWLMRYADGREVKATIDAIKSATPQSKPQVA
ncbi:hypothetical protein [Geopseudomonas aromaticivorans]